MLWRVRSVGYVGGKRLEGEEDMKLEAGGWRRGKVTPYSSGLLPQTSPLQPHSIYSLNLNLTFNLPQSRKTFSMVYWKWTSRSALRFA